jgi:predicted RNA binding protein YcfA (HicA-like mRNA interferase family)
MKIPRNLSGMDVIKVLVKHYNWEVCRRHGSHITLKKKSEAEILTVPLHANLDIGTFLAILRKADIEKEDFLKKL